MRGTLMIIGGGLSSAREAVFGEFIRKAGGKDGRIAFIVTASGEGPDELFRDYREEFESLGMPRERMSLVPVYAPHVRDENGFNAVTGDSPGLCGCLEGVTGVYFTGGDQYFTARCLLREDGSDTALLARLRQIYESGGVIGGSSAGAAVMSRAMIGGGDNRGVISRPAVFGYEGYDAQAEEDDPSPALRLVKGLGFFEEGIVDQHFNRRPRLLRAIEACMSNPEGLRTAFCVSEDTAMVYSRGSFEVLGSAGVYVTDCRRAEKFGAGCYKDVYLHCVNAGDSFDAVNLEAHLAESCAERKEEARRDWISDGITDSPNFDAKVARRVLCATDDSLFYCSKRGKRYAKGGVLYEADGGDYLCVLEYFRDGATRGYMGEHASFRDIELMITSSRLKL